MCPVFTSFVDALKNKPKELTKEEIIFYKEKKICVVCKGKVAGFNTYLCPYCDVIYCEKCARALSLLENVCWACNGAIDPAKPVKPFDVQVEPGKLMKSPKK